MSILPGMLVSSWDLNANYRKAWKRALGMIVTRNQKRPLERRSPLEPSVLYIFGIQNTQWMILYDHMSRPY